MKDLRRRWATTAPEYAGEWTDWWANGAACGPREVVATRLAKRLMTAAQSPLWGEGECFELGHESSRSNKELCLFDEHTWGSSDSVAFPYTLDTLGQFNEKAGLAYRAMVRAEWFLSQRVRTRLVREGEGLWLANPASAAVQRLGHHDCFLPARRLPLTRSIPRPARKLKLYFEPGPLWGRPEKPADLSPEDVSATFPDQVPEPLRPLLGGKPGAGEREALSAQQGLRRRDNGASAIHPATCQHLSLGKSG